MTDAVLKGIGLGLIVSLMVGPVFFLLISTSIKRGFTPAALIAIGVMCNDAFFITIAYFGSAVLLYLDQHQSAASIIGGVIIAAYGVALAFKKAQVQAASLDVPEENMKKRIYLVKGFLLNSINPSVLLFWIVVASTIPVREGYSGSQVLIFYAATLSTILSTDFIKAYSASRLRNIVTSKFLVWMNRIAGSALIIYGLSMIIRGVELI